MYRIVYRIFYRQFYTIFCRISIEYSLEFYIELEDENGTKLSYEQIYNEMLLDGPKSYLCKQLGYSLIEYIEIEINGTKIDKHTGHWMAINSELNSDFNKRINDLFLNGLVQRAPHISENAISINIPLQFWFCKNWGQAIPLIALQYHDIKIDVKLSDLNKILKTQIPTEANRPISSVEFSLASTISDIKLIELNLNCDYIYLDTEERRKFAQNSHEYLIEQIQMLPGEHCSSSTNEILVPLTFNHPIKEIIWTLHDPSKQQEFGELWSGQEDRIKRAVIQLNGVDRFADKPGTYYNTIQKYNHHKGIDLHKFFSTFGNILSSVITNHQNHTRSIGKFCSIPITKLDPFIYSFSLKPGKLQPSGTCNFSRLDNAVLNMTLNKNIPDTIRDGGIDIKIYGIGYNILRIMNGMGGLAYSN